MTSFDYVPRKRTERLIAASRAILAVAGLVAMALSSRQPAAPVALGYGLLVLYAGYAAAVALMVWKVEMQVGRFALATHLLDLPLCAAIILVTDGPLSPFFLYFVFALVAAALRWDWHGVVATAAAAVALQVAIGFVAAAPALDAFDFETVVLRPTFLVVIAALLALAQAHEAERRNEITRLADWVPEDTGDLLTGSLEAARRIFAAESCMLVWEQHEEPYTHWAVIGPSGVRRGREPPGWLSVGLFATEMPDDLAGIDLICSGPEQHESNVAYFRDGTTRRLTRRPFTGTLGARIGSASVLAAAFRTANFEGRLFLLGRDRPTADDLPLARIVARQVGAELEITHARQESEERATVDERMRLARELHDWLAQSLAGLGLQLEALVRKYGEPDPTIAASLRDMRETLATEQRRVRRFIEGARAVRARDETGDLGAVLDDTAARVERDYGLQLKVQPLPRIPELPPGMAGEIEAIVREAAINVARHAGVLAARLRIEVFGAMVVLNIDDGGRGLSVEGRFTQEQLLALKIGPKTIISRAAALGGRVSLESSADGTRLRVALPITFAENEFELASGRA